MNKTSIIFTGDIGFDKYMDGKWKDEALVDNECLDFLRSGNHLVINVEGPLSTQDKIVKENGVTALTHSMDPEVANFFNRIGADVWNINNNHIMDAGEKGMRDTLNIASKNGVRTLGAGMNIFDAAKPVVFEECGGIALIGVGYDRACRIADENKAGCLNFSRMDLIRDSIKEAKKNYRWCVIVAHDGEEFTSLPMPYTRDRYIEYLKMGADIVVAHHPHVPMNYELFNGSDLDKSADGKKAIFYSLGNFIFDTDYQRAQYNTDLGLILKINFSDFEFQFEPYGIKIDREHYRVISSTLPDIFDNVNEEEYRRLLPLAAKAFIENTKRQLKYLKPNEFKDATEEQFVENFYEPLRSGRVPGKLLDMQIVYPLSLRANEDAWKYTELSKVKEYILKQIEDISEIDIKKGEIK